MKLTEHQAARKTASFDMMKFDAKLAAAIELVHNCATSSLDAVNMENLEVALIILASHQEIEITIQK